MRRTSLALVAIVAIALAAFGSGSAAAFPVAHQDPQSRSAVVHYWTEEKMRKAMPAENDSRSAASAKPGKGNGSGTPGAVSAEVPQPYPSTFGKVFFTDNKGVDYVCSGSAIVSANESLVWTAGHCVNEGPGAFYKNFLFVPAYRDGATPYGEFAGTTLLTTSGWQTSGEFGVDVGAAVVGTNAAGQTLSQAVDEAPLVFNATRSQSYRLYGYPAAKRFNGQRMRVCETSWLLDDSTATPATMGVSCDMTGGSSGGAWVTASGAVASVVSYGYSNLRNVLFGPHLETEAQSLYAAASTD